MINKICLVLKYFKYYLSAKHSNGHGIHSPFLFQFAINTIFAKDSKNKYKSISAYLKFLKKTKEFINIDDNGAGSYSNKSNWRRISNIASTASTKRKFGRLLARIVDYIKPSNIIELGTSLGIGTSYLSLNKLPECKVYTIEGSDNLYAFTTQNCSIFNDKNIVPKLGEFDTILPHLLSKLDTIDLVYIDGNHRKEPTIRYFEQLLPILNNWSVLIFDDIHWSNEMEEAWTFIKNNSSVKVSLDLFQVGIVFFNKELSKEDLIIRF